MAELSVLFVCLGNICRSPTAHGVFLSKLAQSPLAGCVEVDSAGTAAFHVGAAPDHRSVKAAHQRGYDLSRLRARQALPEDFHRYDYILAMDHENLRNLADIEPEGGRAELRLFLDYSEQSGFAEVPDPYYGGVRGFDLVLDLVEDAADGLLQHMQQRLRTR